MTSIGLWQKRPTLVQPPISNLHIILLLAERYCSTMWNKIWPVRKWLSSPPFLAHSIAPLRSPSLPSPPRPTEAYDATRTRAQGSAPRTQSLLRRLESLKRGRRQMVRLATNY